MPVSIEPISSPRPSAWAALIVTAASASDGVSPSSRQATVMTSGRLGVGDVPGLKSVPSATGTPRSMSVRAGARGRLHEEPGRGRQEGRHDRPVRLRPPRRGRRSRPPTAPPRWSADSAPISAASSAPPDGASSSAWSRGRMPYASAASRIRRDWSAREHARARRRRRRTAPGPGRRRPAAAPRAGGGRTPPSRSAPVAELRRDGVGAEPGRHDVDRALAAELVGDLEEAQLGRQVEAVAGLRLDRRHPVAEHLVEPAPAVGEQLVGDGGAGRRRPSTGSRRRPPGSRGSRRRCWRRRSSPSRLPANSRWVWGSTSPGVTRPPAASMRAKRASGRSGGLERALDAARRADRDDPVLPGGDDRGLGRVGPTRRRPPGASPRRPGASPAAGRRPGSRSRWPRGSGGRSAAPSVAAAVDDPQAHPAPGAGPRRPGAARGPGSAQKSRSRRYRAAAAQPLLDRRLGGRRRRGRRRRGTRPAARAR